MSPHERLSMTDRLEAAIYDKALAKANEFRQRELKYLAYEFALAMNGRKG